MKIVLIRHAQTKNSANQYIKDDNKDFELSTEGKKNAQLLAVRLKKAGISTDNIYSSCSKRAKQTARIIFPNTVLKTKTVFNEIDKGFKKILSNSKDMGLMSTIDWERTYNTGTNINRLKFRYPSGISLNEYIEKVTASFKEIISKDAKKDSIIIVAHNGTIKSIISFALNGKKDTYHNLVIEHAKYSEIELIDGKFRLNYLNK